MLQKGGNNFVLSLMALRVTKWNTCYKKGVATLSLLWWCYFWLNIIISSCFFPCSTSYLCPFFCFFFIIVVPTITTSMGVFMLVLVLFHSLERLIRLCSLLFYLENVQECLVIYDPSLTGHGAKTWGSMDNQCWNMHTSMCSIVDL